MTPPLRRLMLTALITFSIGWYGTVVGFIVLSVAALNSWDAETVRGNYLLMNLIGQSIIVPLDLFALVTGVILSLGTQ